MWSKFFHLGCLFLLGISTVAQPVSNLPPGFPDRSPNLDVLPGFKHPPKGYGEVSFYWWIGDTLTHERMLWQLDQLKDKGITGLQVNYCHTDKGGASYGLTYPSQPALFSPAWWKFFQWFLKEAKKRDLSVSLSDYTLGAAGQGWFVDEMLKENPGLHGSKLEAKILNAAGGMTFACEIPENPISITAYREIEGKLQPSSAVRLDSGMKGSSLTWNVPTGKWKVIQVYKTSVNTSFDPMNPLSGRKVIEKFYQRFEDNCPGESGKGLNFFFSDELQFGIRGFLWNDRFGAEFQKLKGYDLIPELPHLFALIGPRSYKIRMDYNDVMVRLSEEGFFKPVYQWHNDRGMLFGCDHGGRGRDVTEFGDYFRTQRWMSGPGCDQPGLGRDLVKAKVASSISHLYERPRTWLEGYYGSGWGTSSEEVADATFANFAMGHNLLSLHGLYYTTHGSWWEWAAPDNHWRQPYWQDMGGFLKCSERLSYVLSQGHHACDVAMIYPVAPVEANLKGNTSVETSFAVAKNLYPGGIDFDFMDFESLNRSSIRNRELQVSGEKYKVLILPSLAAIRYTTIEKALEFYRAGGIVLAVGNLPEASDRVGANDDRLQSMVREIFGTTFSDKHDSSVVYRRKNDAGGQGIYFQNPLDSKKIISGLLDPDFKVLSGEPIPGLLHRKLGARDLYFVYGLPKGTSCFFRATGKAELWNPWDGTTSPLGVSSVSESGTTLKLPLEKNEPQLVVFSPGTPVFSVESSTFQSDTLPVKGSWEFELLPTLDNRFGDYRLPAFDGKLGVEAWKLRFIEEKPGNGGYQNPSLQDSNWITSTVSFGPRFLKLGPIPATSDSLLLEKKLASLTSIDTSQPIIINGDSYFWKPYEFSWRWGLKEDAGHQGYHGLKGVVNDELISLGKMDKSWVARPVYPLKAEEAGSRYYLWSAVSVPHPGKARILQSGLLPAGIYLNNLPVAKGDSIVGLNTGANPVLLKYVKPGRGYVVFEAHDSAIKDSPGVPLATRWFLNPGVLDYDCYPSVNNRFGWYRLEAPPGTRSFYIGTRSKPQVWVDGATFQCQPGKTEPGRFPDAQLPVWKVELPARRQQASVVAIRLQQGSGNYGGAAIPEPIIFECEQGTILLGDLGLNPSLKDYSGGMIYRKSVTLTAAQAACGHVRLDLGRVVASAEVLVNGRSTGSRIAFPWIFDLTGKVHAGENILEVKVYNTLGNHYQTTPSQYIGRTSSGLIGPVKIEFR